MPIRIRWSYDGLGENPKKIRGIHISHGYYCTTNSWCDKASACKYCKGFVFHNFSCGLHRFFEYRLHIKLPHWLYINKESTDLSGTDLCPYHKNRRYTCWDCKHAYGDRSCEIQYEDRKRIDPQCDSDWGGQGKCGSFDPLPWANDWDRHTGKHLL